MDNNNQQQQQQKRMEFDTNHNDDKDLIVINKIFVFYATQTGQSESIAKLIYDKLYDIIAQYYKLFTNNNNNNNNQIDCNEIFSKNFNINNFIKYNCISDYDKFINDFWQLNNNNNSDNSDNNNNNNIRHTNLLIIVASTTGQGDPPDKAAKFYRWLRKLKREKQQQQFKHISYALLGLGDTNYDNFCNFSKQLNKFFIELGAISFIDPAFADDAIGLELVTEPFIEKLIATIEKYFEQSNNKKEITLYNDNDNDTCINANNHDDSLLNRKNILISNNKIYDNNNHTNNNSIMNINRPVVSSCISLSSSDKCNLSDICRQLIESSAQLQSILNNEQLILPKINVKKSSKSYYRFIFSKKDLEKLPFYQNNNVDNHNNLDDDEEDNEIKPIKLMKKFLSNRIRNIGSSLYVGQVELSKILSHDNTICCHKQKTLLECNIEYDLNEPYEQKDWFVPGDSFGFYSANSLIDVYQVIKSIKVKCSNYDHDNNDVIVDNNDDDDELILLWDYFKGNKKQVFIVLNDNKDTIVELLPYLFYGVDLRTIPKKITLCHFAQYTNDEQQRRRLLELSSKQGNDEYQNIILAQNITVCDILRLFDTCHPPIDVFFAHLLQSKPRYFSSSSIPKIVSNHPNDNNHHYSSLNINNNNINLNNKSSYKCKFKIIFSVSTNFSHTFMRTSENLLGLFSGKFFHHYEFLPNNFQINIPCTNVWKTIELIHENFLNGNIFDNHDVRLLEMNEETNISFPVFLFKKLNKTFRMIPNELSFQKPLILISTGTGITPFISYLELLQSLINNNNDNQHNLRKKIHKIFFIYGCRHPYQDFIYSNYFLSLDQSSSSNENIINHLCLCFSRTNHIELLKFQMENNVNLCCCYDCHDNDDDNDDCNCIYNNNNVNNNDNINNNYDYDENFSNKKNQSKNATTNNENQIKIKHVDHLIRLHGEELTDLIINHNAIIYICGNYKLITNDIKQAFCDILNKFYFNHQFSHNNDNQNDDDNNENNKKQQISTTKTTTSEAMKYIKQLQQNGRFIQDIWT